MEKDIITIDEQEVMTYHRQGVTGETTVLPSLEEVVDAEDLTLDDRVHSVVDFLKRPIDVINKDLQWKTSTAAGSELLPDGIALPDVFLQNPMVREKLKGFLGLKGTIKARIMLNAQKFQQGVLMPYWIPNYNNLTVKAKMVQQSLSGKSGCAHVLINCEAGTEQTLTIPYVNQNIYYNMATGQGNYGKLFLTPLIQLRSKGDSSVGVRIQMWMEDPQPQFATSAPPNINIVNSQSVSQVEEKKMHTSDSGSLNKGGGLDVARIWKSIDMKDMKPSYLSRTAANTLELMGFCKPTQTASTQRINIRPGSYMANFNGEFTGHKCALAKENQLLSMRAPAGSEEDEMAISAIVKTPTYFKTFQVKCLNNADPDLEKHVVFHDLIHPMKFVPVQPTGVFDSTFLGYVAASFGQWRGGIKYNFVVGKTGFHSGTLRVSFLPGVYDVPPSDLDPKVETWQIERCYQQTFDLRDKTEFSFTVPYAATKPYLNCIHPFDHAAASITKNNWAIGRMLVDVFIPIAAPDTVPDVVDVAVWLSGDTDMTFANPVAPCIFPFSTLNPNIVLSQSMSMNEGVDRVAGIMSDNQKINSSKPKTTYNASAYCTGEVIASTKALCSRFGPFYFPGNTTNANSLVLGPFDFADPMNDVVSTKTFDYLDYFSYLFAFYRGGVRFIMDTGFYNPANDGIYKILMRSTLNSWYPMLSNIARGSVVTTTLLPQQMSLGPSSLSLARNSLEGLIEFEVPYYNTTHITPALVKNQNIAQVQEANYPSPLITITPRYTAGTTSSVNYNPQIYRACADDFRFSYLLGPPQVVLLPTQVDSIPAQIADVSYSSAPVTRSGDNFKGLFNLDNFIIPTTGTTFRAPTQFFVWNQGSKYLTALPYNVNYIFKKVGSEVEVTTPNFPSLTGSYLWTCRPNLSFSDSATTLETLSYTQFVGPGAGYVQSFPVPCTRFTFIASTFNSNKTALNLTNQGVVPLDGNPFDLTNYLVVFQVNATATENYKAILLDLGTRVYFSRVSNGSGSYFIKVSDTQLNLLGYLAITSFATSTGFPEGVETPSLTEINPLKEARKLDSRPSKTMTPFLAFEEL